MVIPKFHELMLPVLKFCSDRKEHTNQELNNLHLQLNLSEEDRNELLPNKPYTKICDRIHWAKSYLKQAGLLHYPRRGVSQITEKGLKVLQDSPSEIDVSFLQQFEEFREFQNRSKRKLKENSNEEFEEDCEEESTPLESLRLAYEEINSSVQSDLLDEVKRCSPRFFEKLVLDLLVAMGYGNSNIDSAELTPYTNDKGIDGIIKEDSLGLDKIYLQAKRWQDRIGRKELHEFVGALAGKRAKKGVFITTSSFKDTAIKYVESELGIDTKVVLIDGLKLAELMMKFTVGVSIKETLYLKKIDSDYFEDIDF